MERLSKTYRDRSGHEVVALAAEQLARVQRFMKRTIPLRSIVDTSFVEEVAQAVPER